LIALGFLLAWLVVRASFSFIKPGPAPSFASGVLGFFGYADSGDDRPPIVVSDGSIKFEGGDSKNPKKGQDPWDKVRGSSKEWKPVQPGGHSVVGFTVYVGGAIDPANCTQTTMALDSVEIDFNPTGQGTTTWVYNVQHVDDGSGQHQEPHVIVSNDGNGQGLLSGASSTSSASLPTLTEGTTNVGFITKVTGTVTDGSAPPSCSFATPDSNGRNLDRVTIFSERK
jgi:hypothetical protein